MIKNLYILCIAFLCSATLAFANEQPVIEASLETDTMRIGEQQHIVISVEYPEKQTIILPELVKEVSHNILITDTYTFDTVKANKNGSRKVSATIPITCFDAGEYSFKIGPFVYQNDSLWSKPLKLSVQTVALDSTDTIKPIKPIRQPQYTWKDHLPLILTILGIILLIAAIVFGIWYYKKHRKPKTFGAKAKHKEKPDVKALRDLETLKSMNLCEKEEFKSFYTDLTDILREYFGDVLGIDTFEKTSDELINEVITTGKLPFSAIQNLKIVLQEADFVKFAKHKPTIETGNLHYGLALFCINETKHLIQQIETDTTEQK